MCLHPIQAWRSLGYNENGRQVLHFTPPQDPEAFFSHAIKVPCGKCLGCLDDRRKRWVNRLILEFDRIQTGTFITLTYRDAPEHPSKSDAQKFIKRLRNASRDYGLFIPSDFKYFLCAERGSEFGRPHYHALLFGLDMFEPGWQSYIATFKNKHPVWASRLLERIWPHGFNTIGEITPSAIRYVAKYTTKSQGQEDCFTLKSMRLGCSKFFNIRRSGRSVNYDYSSPEMREFLIRGNIHLANGNRDPINVRIPSAYHRYVERISEADFLDLRMMRQFQAEVFADKPFDQVAYVERLENENQKDKIKRRLDNEKVRICHS